MLRYITKKSTELFVIPFNPSLIEEVKRCGYSLASITKLNTDDEPIIYVKDFLVKDNGISN